MQPTELNPGDGNPEGTALTILRAFGDRAVPLVDEQIALCGDRPDLAGRWTAIMEAMRCYVAVDAHLTIALDLLDAMKVMTGATHLDAAIVELGLRTDRDDARPAPRDTGWSNGDHYAQRARRHLSYARETDDLPAKGLHLDLASNYATLHQVTAAPAGGDATRPHTPPPTNAPAPRPA